jgi:hypothetical protein
MLFDTRRDDFPYTVRGTCFLCSYEGRNFAVSAAHVAKGFMASQVLIPENYSSRAFLSVQAGFDLKAADQSDPDWSDLIVYELASIDQRVFKNELPFEVSSSSVGVDMRSGGKLVLRGFPCFASFADYERMSIHRQAHLFCLNEIMLFDRI